MSGRIEPPAGECTDWIVKDDARKRMILARPWRQIARDLWPWFAVMVPIAIIAKLVQSGAGIATPPLWHHRWDDQH